VKAWATPSAPRTADHRLARVQLVDSRRLKKRMTGCSRMKDQAFKDKAGSRCSPPTAAFRADRGCISYAAVAYIGGLSSVGRHEVLVPFAAQEVRREDARSNKDQTAIDLISSGNRGVREIHRRSARRVAAWGDCTDVTAIVTASEGNRQGTIRWVDAEGARSHDRRYFDGKDDRGGNRRQAWANSVIAPSPKSAMNSVQALVAATMERFGRIECCVKQPGMFAPLQETKCTRFDADSGTR